MKKKNKLTRLRNLKEDDDAALHCMALSTDSLRSTENPTCAVFFERLSFKSPEQTLECRFNDEDFVDLLKLDWTRLMSFAASPVLPTVCFNLYRELFCVVMRSSAGLNLAMLGSHELS